MIGNLPGVKMHVVKNTNDFTAVRELLEKVESGNEYYLAAGRHAAIIRKMKAVLNIWNYNPEYQTGLNH